MGALHTPLELCDHAPIVLQFDLAFISFAGFLSHILGASTEGSGPRGRAKRTGKGSSQIVGLQLAINIPLLRAVRVPAQISLTPARLPCDPAQILGPEGLQRTMRSGKRFFERLEAENSARQQASILVQQASKAVCEIRLLRSLIGAGEGFSLRQAGRNRD
jgi:hypothetical protein